MISIGQRDIDALPVVGRAPADAARLGIRSNQSMPDNLAGYRVERPVAAALLANADLVAFSASGGELEQLG